MVHYPLNPLQPASCPGCAFLEDCGGLDGDDYYKGCFARCLTYCTIHGCDMVCPVSGLAFGDYIADVGGLCTPPQVPLVAFDASELPPYVPQINHGGSRTNALDEPWVTVPLYEVVGPDRKGRYSAKFQSPEHIRLALKVSRRTKIIVTSVAPDQVIEDFWAEHVVRSIPEQLARLGIAAMTVPNYSFMRDVSRINSLYNMSRSFRVAERLTEAGIPTILHLNASTKKDWGRFASILRDQPHISSVCVEFQTGPRIKEIGNRYFAGLVELRDAVGRELHPIALAGTGRIIEFRRCFPKFTVVDAMPFMKTMHRQTLVRVGGRWKWRKKQTPPSATLNQYLASNIQNHRACQLERAGLPLEGLGQQSLLLTV
jgi:hypothetical protein